jgi:hypothetical protein
MFIDLFHRTAGRHTRRAAESRSKHRNEEIAIAEDLAVDNRLRAFAHLREVLSKSV